LLATFKRQYTMTLATNTNKRRAYLLLHMMMMMMTRRPVQDSLLLDKRICHGGRGAFGGEILHVTGVRIALLMIHGACVFEEDKGKKLVGLVGLTICNSYRRW